MQESVRMRNTLPICTSPKSMLLTLAWLMALKPPIIIAVEVRGVVAPSELGRPVTAATAAVVPTGAAWYLCK
jgi:hypothetical protein